MTTNDVESEWLSPVVVVAVAAVAAVVAFDGSGRQARSISPHSRQVC